jgi:hypothetical protein
MMTMAKTKKKIKNKKSNKQTKISLRLSQIYLIEFKI